MKDFTVFVRLVLVFLLSLSTWVAHAQTSLLDAINAELGAISITIPLNNQVVTIPRSLIDETEVTLIEAVCTGFGIGGITLAGAESGTQLVEGVPYEQYTINAGVVDITGGCSISISSRSTLCANTRTGGSISVSATDFDISTQINLLSEDFETSGPTLSLPDTRECSELVNLVVSDPVYSNVIFDSVICFGTIPIDGTIGAILNALAVTPLLNQLSSQICEPIRNATAPLADLLLTVGTTPSSTPVSIQALAASVETQKLGGDDVFDVPSDGSVEASDATKNAQLVDGIVADITEAVEDVVAELDEQAETNPELAQFLAVARATIPLLANFSFDISSISLQEIVDLALQPNVNITAILEAITGDAALAAQLAELLDAAITALDLGALDLGDLFPQLQNITGGGGAGGGGVSAANITAELIETLEGILSGDVTAEELIELITSLIPGNSTFGLEAFTDEIDTVLGLLSGGTSGQELIDLILDLIPGNETFGLDTPAAAELIDLLLNGTALDNVDLVPLLQDLLDTFLPEQLLLAVPGLGEVGIGVELTTLNFSLPTTGELATTGQTSVVLPPIRVGEAVLGLTLNLFFNISISLPPLVDIGPVVFEDAVEVSFRVGEWAAAASLLFGFDYDTLLEAAKFALVDPLNFAGCSGSTVYLMLSGVFVDFTAFDASVFSADEVVAALLETVNIFFDVYGSTFPALIEGAVMDSTSGIMDQDIAQILPAGEQSCSELNIVSGGGGGEGGGEGGAVADLLPVFIIAPLALVGMLAAAVVFYNRRGANDLVLPAEEAKPLGNSTPNPVHNAVVAEAQGAPTGEEENKLAKDAIDAEI